MTEFMALISVLVVFVLVLLVCREIYCWYTKANDMVSIQREILEQLKAMNRYFDSLES